MGPLTLLQQFVSAYGPPGQEDEVRLAIEEWVRALDLQPELDVKGNLLVRLGDGPVDVVVTAHMDEIALMVKRVRDDGRIEVVPLGGIHPWKFGEGAVEVLAPTEYVPGILGFGGIHTEDESSTVVRARSQGVTWEMAEVFTGLPKEDLERIGVRPGTRVVISRSRRNLTRFGDFVAGHFLDDRADIVAWLLALGEVKDSGINAVFAATVEEEIGGLGAQYVMQSNFPTVCVALELGPNVPDAPVELSDVPTVWTRDSFAVTSARDLDLLASVGRDLGMELQYQTMSRGGSDASCAAARGLCARAITLGIPMENSHGYEIMHTDAMASLARLTGYLLPRLM